MLKNHKLAKHISDASWRTFINFLKYKCQWYGKHFVEVDPFFASTKTCFQCKNKQAMPLNIRAYVCNMCGFVIDRDLNAALNIRTAGHAALSSLVKPKEDTNACGEISIS